MLGKLAIYFITLIFFLFSVDHLFGQINFSKPQKLEIINSEVEESLPLFFGNGLYFVRSFHSLNKGGLNGGHDIWYSERLSKDHWASPNNSFPYFNTHDNNAIVGVSRDGNRIYLMSSYHQSEERSIRIEVSMKEGNNWSIPKRLMLKDVSPEGKFSGFFMHPSEKILLISMKGKNSLGGEDLHVCLVDNWGRWSNLIHLGRTINTKGFEISPFLSSDSKTLFFSSNGRSDSKNADIYYSTRLDNTWKNWSDPVRLPDGINSDAFDAYFFLTDDGEAFFVSNRDSEFTDIYSARLIDAPLQATNDIDKAQIDLDPFYSNTPEISDISQFESQGTAFVYFDFASAELSDEMKEILKYIVEELKGKSDYRVELSGYADDLGPEGYNRILSQKRAESVKQFLVNEGLLSQKILPMGKGMVLIDDSEKNETLRQKNRRVELVILN